MNMITIACFFDPQSADLARMALEAGGVPVLLQSQGHASLGISVALGGVRVQVPEPFIEDARTILKSLAEDTGAEL
jgi:hypothetical protein